MDKKELLEKAFERLEAMSDTIKMAKEALNDIYAERQLIYFLLWLSEEEELKSK